MEIIDTACDSKISSNDEKEINRLSDISIKKNSKSTNNTSTFTSDGERTENDLDSTQIIRQKIDIKRNRYPYCIVWTPLPCISWFLPFIGHTGICG